MAEDDEPQSAGRIMAELAIIGALLRDRYDEIEVALRSPDTLAEFAPTINAAADELERIAGDLRNLRPWIEIIFDAQPEDGDEP